MLAGRPTVRKAELLGGNRMAKKRMPAAERQQETGTSMVGSSAGRSRITGRIRAAARTRKGADVGQVSL